MTCKVNDWEPHWCLMHRMPVASCERHNWMQARMRAYMEKCPELFEDVKAISAEVLAKREANSRGA
jgi:hypothetical protein